MKRGDLMSNESAWRYEHLPTQQVRKPLRKPQAMKRKGKYNFYLWSLFTSFCIVSALFTLGAFGVWK